ncbi:AAA family ATPase [Mangrovibrevibacter kandeliae]|uniref:AAA family ATPase n=1 Tax=Mangrovibrevibacter kandeliae TaxID=2968473 RepID=UPI002117A46C|nr:AAA family ATPase [Aurantimonas sp. CSK15Z-1]MCQ8784162.1 AAA family ATPase [Aurantimonas sp. CSK15Z-1]
MRISSISISNFRGIHFLETGNLGDTIIIAGQNGSGKSCIFDAIRLLKSVYGGYQQNEWQHFFNEFQIQLHGGSKYLRGLFNDSLYPVVIKAEFQLRDREKKFISNNAPLLLEETVWQSVLPEAFQYGGYHKAMFASQFRDRQPEVNEKVAYMLPELFSDLSTEKIVAKVTINPHGDVEISRSQLISVVFTNYRPRELGVIDFHGAQRHYGRENVQGTNLSLDQIDQNRSQSSLYNYKAKYNNVKSEMAGNYVKEILAEKAGPISDDDQYSLSNTLKELFTAFFPDKEFLGPRPTTDGSLAFPVRTQNGTEHDLDELSSGEKEILYGYLRIRSSAPKDSIILLDEPELHLNPRLIRGLPEFYRTHLGEALENQLWLVTHSDALIREAVGKPGFNVFHMLPCGAEAKGTSQLRSLATKDLDLVLADLVGDLAAYRPGGKGVIFEGGGDSDFDKTLASILFSEEVRGINLISGSNKSKVRALHEVLRRAHSKGDLPTKFYAVVDRDSDKEIANADGVTEFQWDVYHIENYLLHPGFVAETVNSFTLGEAITPDQAHAKLASAARNVVPAIIRKQLQEYANDKLVGSINLKFDPSSDNVPFELRQALERSFDKVSASLSDSLTESNLRQKEEEFKKDIEASFGNGSWLSKLPGREILKQFVSVEGVPTNYEAFRNQIASRMAAAGHKPAGMAAILDKIKAD